MARTTIECCPHCDKEVILPFDDNKPVFTRVCPNCGKKIMVCNECLYRNDFCDWNDERGCYREREEKRL